MLQELEDRNKFLGTLLSKYQLSADNQGGPAGTSGIDLGPPLAPDEAVAVLLRNERGRQAREKANVMLAAKKQVGNISGSWLRFCSKQFPYHAASLSGIHECHVLSSAIQQHAKLGLTAWRMRDCQMHIGSQRPLLNQYSQLYANVLLSTALSLCGVCRSGSWKISGAS